MLVPGLRARMSKASAQRRPRLCPRPGITKPGSSPVFASNIITGGLMKSINTVLIGLVAIMAMTGCSGASSEEETNKTINAAMEASAAADAAMARANAAIAGIDQREAKTNGGMDNIELKTSADLNLRALLKDADSAKYKDEFLSRIDGGNLMLCGKVNSKNAFGAYTGFKRFIASPNPDAPTLIEGEVSGMGAAVDNAFPQAYAQVCSNPVERF